MARPPKPPEERRVVRQQVMLTEQERRELEEGAELLGTSMGDVLREGGLRYLRRERQKAETQRRS